MIKSNFAPATSSIVVAIDLRISRTRPKVELDVYVDAVDELMRLFFSSAFRH